jgi:hypothetical protein
LKPSGALTGFPHDLLKPFDWRRHEDPRILPEGVRQALSKYKVDYVQFDGKRGQLTLEQVVRGHGTAEGFWQRMWAEADRLSAAVARLRLEYDYWHEGQTSPFFIKVYGEPKVWDEKKVNELRREISQTLLDYADDERRHGEAMARVNWLLREFPSDSRFPFVSLRTHHLMTDALRSCPLLWEKCRGGKPKLNKLYLMRVSVAEPEFHKLKQMREFHALRSNALGRVRSELRNKNPLSIGDDLYVLLLSGDEVEKTISAMQGIGFGLDVHFFEWNLDKTQTGLYVVKELGARARLNVGFFSVARALGVFRWKRCPRI